VHTHTHTNTCALKQLCEQVHNEHLHVCAHWHILTSTHAHTLMHTCTCTRARTFTQTHIRTHARTHVHIHTHARTNSSSHMHVHTGVLVHTHTHSLPGCNIACFKWCCPQPAKPKWLCRLWTAPRDHCMARRGPHHAVLLLQWGGDQPCTSKWLACVMYCVCDCLRHAEWT